MIDLYTFNTPNGRKASLMLEELGAEYTPHRIDIGAGDQFKPDFLKISPNNKIPALIDSDGPGGAPISVFETGAILVYLGDKFGKFYPTDPVKRMKTLEWLFWQVGGMGPMFGQAGHFVKFAPEEIPYAKNRYLEEAKRLLGVLDKRLGETGAYLVGDEYTIADIAAFPWYKALEFYGLPEVRAPFENAKRWADEINTHPAVEKAWVVV